MMLLSSVCGDLKLVPLSRNEHGLVNVTCLDVAGPGFVSYLVVSTALLVNGLTWQYFVYR